MNLSKSLLEAAQNNGLIIINDGSARWYNHGAVGDGGFGPLQDPRVFEELWPDTVQEALSYCIRAASSGLPVVYVSDGEDAFLLTTSPATVVEQWLSSLPE